MPFPTNPSIGQTYTNIGGAQFQFTAQGAWKEIATGSAAVAPQGALFGVGVPASIVGIDSDYYVDLATGLLYGPRAGGVWPAPTGAAVFSPQSLLSGAGAPGAGVGGNGNYYIDTVSGLLYGPKTAGAWPAASVAMFSSTPLLTGVGAPVVGQGVNGDFYADLASGLVYGPKAAGAWPAASGLSIYSSNNLIVGQGTPSNTVGQNGQFYLDATTGLLYGPKASGTWPTSAAQAIYSAQALLTGLGPPSNSLGNNGNYYIDSVSGLFYGPKAAGSWPATTGTGINSPQTLMVGSGAPSVTVGNNGCYYVDLATGLLYGPKAAGVWPGAPTLLIPQANMNAGSTAGSPPSNAIGSNGSYFLDISSGLIFGPKAAGVWPAAPAISGSRTAVNDVNAVATVGSVLIAYTGITAPRTATLPAANAVPGGKRITVVDESGLCSSANIITVTALGADTINGLASFVLGSAYASVTVESNGANAWTEVARTSVSILSSAVPAVRLTLQANVPVMTGSVVSATAIRATPYQGSVLPLWNGSSFVLTSFSDTAQLLSDATNSPAAAVANSTYDMFGWLKAGVFVISRGPVWTNNTTRGYTLSRVNGLLVNTSAITNGPGAGAGLFLGTISTDNAGATVSWSFGSAASGGGAANLNVWNNYNRADVATVVTDNASYVVNAISFRQAHASTGNQVTWVSGVAEDAALVDYNAYGSSPTAAATWAGGIGLDTVVANNGSTGGNTSNIAGVSTPAFSYNSRLVVPPQVGQHTAAAVETTTGTSITLNAANNNQLSFKFRM